ncbi:MAG TPA: CCA tRNA nucleotidyltransferase [Chlamydiales bacterium]|jgi:poly(A) polymerase|nr:CCA tRNA nucleotidyltransferase [Chlamydiales bacterium]
MEEHPQARFIIETLAKAGFIAYYAGGWVRDFLLGHPSDDIDIATNAPPETIQALFPKTVPIGIAFGILLVLIDGREYEVATFRSDIDYRDGRRPTRVEFTTAEEDAQRRDFTINGMFYDPLKEEILDFVGGKKDLDAKILRAIGNPHERIKEDRLRMIRAIRLSCRFHFSIEAATAAAIRSHSNELFPAVAIERIVQELEKAHKTGKLRPMLIGLHAYHLLEAIFPSLQGIPLAEIERRVEPIKHFPIDAPLIAFILELFPDFSLEEVISLAKSLKLSNLDQQFAAFLVHAKELLRLDRPISLSEWAYFYANRFSTVSLQIFAAPLEEKPRAAFFARHEGQIALLAQSIERIRTRDPLIKSNDLAALGIIPSKTMGVLLEAAESISINEQLHDKQSVLERLKEHPDWPSTC